MPLNKIYQLSFKQQYGSTAKFPETVWFYEHTAGISTSEQLANDFVAQIVPKITDLQTSGIHNRSVRVINLGDLADFYEAEVLGDGAYVAQTLPPQDALSYTFKLNTRAVKHGGKRISGIPETVANAGEIDDDTYKGKMAVLKNAMALELVSADDTWLPVVLKRVKEPVAGTVPLQYTYRLPETDGELVTGEIVTVLLTNIVKSQVSRKI